MSEAIGWIRQIPSQRNFQLLGVSICLAVAWVTIFVIRSVPQGIPNSVVLGFYLLVGAVTGVSYVAVDATGGVGPKNTMRFVVWVSAGALMAGIVGSSNLVAPVVGLLGFGSGYALGAIITRDATLVIAAWNLLLLTVLIGIGATVLLTITITPQATAGIVVAGAVLIGFHDILADELGVTFE